MAKFKFYLITEDGDVQGTDDPEISAVASRDGSTTVINYEAGLVAFDGDTAEVEKADPSDWPVAESDEDDE